MSFLVLDPNEFLDNGLFLEDIFLQQTAEFDWSQFTDKKVLVRGCATIIPPWAYMLIASRLTGVAKSVRYGNEHDHIVVYRSKGKIKEA